MTTAAALVTVLFGVVALLLTARLLLRRHTLRSPRPAAGAAVPAAAIAGVVLALIGQVTTAPLYWAAAGVAAISTATAIALRFEVGAVFRIPAYTVPSLGRRPPGSPGAISAAAALAAAAGALATAALAYRVRLLGPSDPALVALAAYLGMLVDCRFEEAFGPRGLARAAGGAAAALLAALLAAALVVLLP
jgi:uncharacterized membrane protein